MKDVFLLYGGIEGVRVVVLDFFEEFVVGEFFKIVGISKLNNFCFIGGKFIVWRVYVVGKGKLLDLIILGL